MDQNFNKRISEASYEFARVSGRTVAGALAALHENPDHMDQLIGASADPQRSDLREVKAELVRRLSDRKRSASAKPKAKPETPTEPGTEAATGATNPTNETETPSGDGEASSGPEAQPAAAVESPIEAKPAKRTRARKS